MKTKGEMLPTKAAIEAGYSKRSAPIVACRLLKKPEGQVYLKSLQKDSTHAASVSLAWVMETLMCTVSAGISDSGLIDYKALPCSIQAISEINKIKGYYAPDKKLHLNMTMDDIQEARAREFTINYARDY